ncbi:M57 family metalloprotease [Fibrella aquatilis]|uniref:Protease n=1 Tax=Fibrella aquatilis TaxID=2817059 RepID=A0A939G8F4_9BACT|nr:M57 family metalloprotease [Fibrella aquatilis]MBO0931698.1 protease [Fibrella aquatilis]
MKRITLYLTALVVGGVLYGCQPIQDEATPTSLTEIDPALEANVRSLGFSTAGMQRVEGGYIVENDIFLDEHQLSNGKQVQLMRVGNEEQYRTTNLVNNLPRTITVSLASGLPAGYAEAMDVAIARYNAEPLQIKMARVRSGGDIKFVAAPAGVGYLASAGFPSGGNPFNQVKVNTSALPAIDPVANTTKLNNYASIFAHEMGHCIGFRHTDYMDRSYSCGGAVANEGASSIGAILIPGTPAAADPNSWMLACIGSTTNRPFNANDKIALDALY